MAIEVVPASGWFAENLTEQEREVLKRSGILPISDRFLSEMFYRNDRYQVIYGGRGSGKSETVARKLLKECDELPYFRCIYSRKIADTLRDSCFALLQKAIKEMGMADRVIANRSTMAIIHENGNNFIAKGIDKPEKVKSTDEPSHLWCEEITEFNEEDFATLDDSIRTLKTKPQTIVTFNPVRITSWVREKFFDPLDAHAPHPEYGDSLFVFRSTLYDNHFINREAYAAQLMRSAAGNKNRLRVNLQGDWGVSENNNPWLYSFDAEKHIRKTLPFLTSFPVYLSFDFNRDPVTCVAFQMSPHKGGRDSFIHIIKEFGGKIQLHDLCAQILTTYPASILFVTGDSSGRAGNVAFASPHDSSYSLIRSHLHLSAKQMHVNTHNILHENSRMLMNAMFYNYPNLYISEEAAPNLITDCELAEVDDKSEKAHALKKDRDQYKMDYFDGMRYFFQQYFQEFADSAYFKLHG